MAWQNDSSKRKTVFSTLPMRIKVEFCYWLFMLASLIVLPLSIWAYRQNEVFFLLVMGAFALNTTCMVISPLTVFYICIFCRVEETRYIWWCLVTAVLLLLPLLATFFFNTKPKLYAWMVGVPWIISWCFCVGFTVKHFVLLTLLILFKDSTILFFLMRNGKRKGKTA